METEGKRVEVEGRGERGGEMGGEEGGTAVTPASQTARARH